MKALPRTGVTERDLTDAVRSLMIGRSNATGRVTLRASQTTTTITGDAVNENAEVFLTPRTANAAAALATTYASISRISGVPTVTITHANNAQTDRTFGYVILGG